LDITSKFICCVPIPVAAVHKALIMRVSPS
jgi:hypothetical protein